MCKEYRGPIKAYHKLGIEQLHLPTIDHTEPSLQDMKVGFFCQISHILICHCCEHWCYMHFFPKSYIFSIFSSLSSVCLLSNIYSSYLFIYFISLQFYYLMFLEIDNNIILHGFLILSSSFFNCETKCKSENHE